MLSELSSSLPSGGATISSGDARGLRGSSALYGALSGVLRVHHADAWHDGAASRPGWGLSPAVQPPLRHLPSLGSHILTCKMGVRILPPGDCDDDHIR